MTITLIGDVHGHIDEYVSIVRKHDATIQLGDFGFGREWNALNYLGIDQNVHKIIPGNHDDYDACVLSPFSLGDYGPRTVNGQKFFFVRGGYSIDCGDRRSDGDKTWWHQEQLDYASMRACEESWKRNCPEIVFTHTPPNRIIKQIGNEKIMAKYGYEKDFQCSTSQFLDFLFDIHQPKLWVFGHMHISCSLHELDCEFVGLKELETFTI